MQKSDKTLDIIYILKLSLTLIKANLGEIYILESQQKKKNLWNTVTSLLIVGF